jgi:hypothetical protein
VKYGSNGFDTNGSFKIQFTSAVMISHLLEYLYGNHCKNNGLEKNYFEINDDGLIYFGNNPGGSILHKATIYKKNMLHFEKLNQNSLRFNIVPEQFKANIKMGVNKSPIVTSKENSNDIYVLESENDYRVRRIEKIPLYDGVGLSEPDVGFNVDRPNAVMLTSQLNLFCKGLTAKQNVNIQVFNNRLLISKKAGGNMYDVMHFFTNDLETMNLPTDDQPIADGDITSNMAKNLCKLYKLSKHGLIRFYSENGNGNERNNILMLHLDIDSLGEIRTYVILS